jgi:hypothetical protein
MFLVTQFTYDIDKSSESYIVDGVSLDPNPLTETRLWIALRNSKNGKLLILNKNELAESDKVWKNLQPNQKVTLNHYLEYWKLFGTIIVKKHIDILK